MAKIEETRSCPLGHQCTSLKDGKIDRCVAYLEIEGAHPQTGAVSREHKCSIFEWQPILLLEIARTNRGQTAAIETFRNEMVKSNIRLGAALTAGSAAKLVTGEVVADAQPTLPDGAAPLRLEST